MQAISKLVLKQTDCPLWLKTCRDPARGAGLPSFNHVKFGNFKILNPTQHHSLSSATNVFSANKRSLSLAPSAFPAMCPQHALHEYPKSHSLFHTQLPLGHPLTTVSAASRRDITHLGPFNTYYSRASLIHTHTKKENAREKRIIRESA